MQYSNSMCYYNIIIYTDLDMFDSAVVRQLTNFDPAMILAPYILRSELSQWRVAEIPSSCGNHTPMDSPLNFYTLKECSYYSDICII